MVAFTDQFEILLRMAAVFEQVNEKLIKTILTILYQVSSRRSATVT